jgi:GntR family transcriptional regulator
VARASHEGGLRYRVVADALRLQVRRARAGSKQRLPTEVELASHYGVSRGTVRRAYLDLVSEGLVERVPGRGSFPAARGPYRRAFNTVEELLSLSEDTLMEVVEPMAIVTDPDAALALGLQYDDVLRIAYRRSHDSVTFCYTEVFVPPRLKTILEPVAFLHQASASSNATVLGFLDQHVPISGTRQVVTAVAAPPGIAGQIGCDDGQPVLRIERVHFDAKGAPVERCVNHFNPDRYMYRLQLHRR